MTEISIKEYEKMIQISQNSLFNQLSILQDKINEAEEYLLSQEKTYNEAVLKKDFNVGNGIDFLFDDEELMLNNNAKIFRKN